MGEEQQHGEGGLSTSSVQSKLNQEELDLLLKPALILKPPLNAHLLLLLDLGEELLVNDILLKLLSAACDQYQHAVVLCAPLEEIHVCFHN